MLPFQNPVMPSWWKMFLARARTPVGWRDRPWERGSLREEADSCRRILRTSRGAMQNLCYKSVRLEAARTHRILDYLDTRPETAPASTT